jgi:hypothetical protein
VNMVGPDSRAASRHEIFLFGCLTAATIATCVRTLFS